MQSIRIHQMAMNLARQAIISPRRLEDQSITKTNSHKFQKRNALSVEAITLVKRAMEHISVGNADLRYKHANHVEATTLPEDTMDYFSVETAVPESEHPQLSQHCL